MSGQKCGVSPQSLSPVAEVGRGWLPPAELQPTTRVTYAREGQAPAGWKKCAPVGTLSQQILRPLQPTQDISAAVGAPPDGTGLAVAWGMSTLDTPITYNEPTTIWRMRHPTNGEAHAVINPARPYSTAVWFVDGIPADAGDFQEWRLVCVTAVRWKLQAEG